MNQEQSIKSRAVPGRQPIRVRVNQLKRSSGLSVIGGVELAGLACAILLALVTAFLYFYLLLPARSRARSAELDHARVQAQLRAAEANFTEDSDTKKAVDNINTSLEDFENNYLVGRDNGRMSLYAKLNDLIRSNGLRNTAGPSYATLEPTGTKTQQQILASADKQSTAKWQSVYPGIAVTVTVEGPYQNVRHFVRDIEMSRQFLVINAVELEGVQQSAAPQALSPMDPRTMPRTNRPPVGMAPPRSAAVNLPPPIPGTRGTTVSLRLDMSTYFQRGKGDSAAP